MKVSIPRAWNRMMSVLRKDLPVRSGVTQMAEYCAERYRSPVWKKILASDFEAEESNLRGWLEYVLTQERPNKSINAFWFGLALLSYGKGRPSWGLYIAGSKRWSRKEKDIEWAVDPEYWPEARYAESRVLVRITKLLNQITDGDVRNLGEYLCCLGTAALLIRHICGTLSPTLLLGNRDSRAVAIGFDEGDGLILGEIGRNGWLSGRWGKPR